MSVKNLSTIVIDRFWHNLLFAHSLDLAIEFANHIRPYKLIGIETGGASGFSGRLRNNSILDGRLFVFSEHEYSKLRKSFDTKSHFEINKLLESDIIKSSLRIYKAHSGIFADDDKKMIYYLIRMLALTAIVKGEYFASPDRLLLAECIFSIYNIPVKKTIKNNLVSLYINTPLPFIKNTTDLTIVSIQSPIISNSIQIMENNNTSESKKADLEPHVFISYFHGDREEARIVRANILEAGFNVWWDQDILPGQNWKLEIKKSLMKSFCIIVCFSANMLDKNKSGMYPEIYDAIEITRTLKPGSIFIIPIRFSVCEIPNIPISDTSSINHIQYIDVFSNSINNEANINKLIKAISFAFENVV